MSGKKALIVDDAYFMRNLIKKVLKEAGYEVVGEAKNGKEGITLYFELKPDFVTMDINMPDINGIEATRQILSKDPNAQIIAVTGVDNEETKEEMLKAGAKAYLKKPFQPAFLLSKIEEMFENKEEISTVPKENQPTSTAQIIADEAEEDFFEDKEIDILNKPDEQREKVIVIQNNEDQIEFPEEHNENREKFALTKEALMEESVPDRDEENHLPTFPKEEAKEEKEIHRTTEQHTEQRNEQKQEQVNSYIQIRPPRAKIYSSPSYPFQQDDEDIEEPVISQGNKDNPTNSKPKKSIFNTLFGGLFKK